MHFPLKSVGDGVGFGVGWLLFEGCKGLKGDCIPMFKKCIGASLFLMLPGLLCGCGVIGSKSFSLSVVYAACAVVSLILLCGYCLFERKKDGFFLLLLSSVLIVNSGYFSLSVSRSLEEALLANRISYIGSVLLPFSMLMSILEMILELVP